MPRSYSTPGPWYQSPRTPDLLTKDARTLAAVVCAVLLVFLGQWMPAVGVHATEILNQARSGGLRRLPPAAEEWFLAASAIGISVLLMRLRPLLAAAMAVLAEVLLFGLCGPGFRQERVWFPWLTVSAVQVPGALGGSILFHAVEWYRARRRLETARRAAEARVREQAAILDKAQDAILVQELQGRVLYANPAAERLYGWSRAELLQEGARQQLFAPAAGNLAESRLAVQEKGEWAGELELATRSGQKLIMESRWTLIRDESGRAESVLLINTDVTEKKRLEAHFLRAQRMDTVGALAGGMAHDLNNALAPIMIGIQLLAQRAQDEETRELLAAMEANTHRGAELVRQVLTFARGRGHERGLLNVGRLVREIGNVARQTLPKSIRLATMVPRDLWPVLGNATEIHQVLLNLCVNSRDAMPNGGELTVAVDNVALGEEEARGMPNASAGRYVMVLVSDTGMGIDPAVLPRIFEPYFTTKPSDKGTGLGLSTVARIVGNHAGFIQIRSRPGEGTDFEVYFPAAAAQAAPTPERLPDQLPGGHGETVLLIEDDRSVREMVAASLSEYDYAVVTAADGVEALALLDGAGREVRLVLADQTIPPTDGSATLELIRARCPGVPVILMSGELDSDYPPGLSGHVVLLAKPFGLDQLLNAIAGALRSAPSQA